MKCPKCTSESIVSDVFVTVPATFYHNGEETEIDDCVVSPGEVDKNDIDNYTCLDCHHEWF